MAAFDAPSAPQDLLQQRTQVLAWLARLDEVAQGAPAHIVERIRRDYQERLDRLTRALAEHLDTLRAQLRDVEERWRTAEARLQQARDALEELRLRHLLGEVTDDEWNDRRAALDDTVGAAERKHTELGDERERLRRLVAEIGESASPLAAETASTSTMERTDRGPDTEAAASPSEPTTVAARVPEADDELAFLRELPDSQPATASPADGWDDSFLRELDQVLATSGAASRPESKTLRCKECGALNDPRAWYCEICGADLT